jgi:type IV pilus assembly protein PilQ
MKSNQSKMPVWVSLAAGLALMAAWPVYAANVLNRVSVAEGPNQSQVIKIIMKDPVETMPVSFTTSNPHRLVVDFADTTNSIGRVVESLNSATIKNYQVVQAGDRTRVVFNLNVPASHELRKDRNMILVVLQGAIQKADAGMPASAPAKFAAASTQREYGIRDVDFRRGKNGEGHITISLTDPGVGIDIQQKGRDLQVDFLNTNLPAALQRRLDVADFATPAQLIETFEQGKNTRMIVKGTTKGKWDYSAHQTGNQFVMELRSLDDPSLAKSDKPIYSGEKLTLNFQNVEVRAVLQVIADFTGLNIIASDTVTGNVTLRLKDVPWDQALDIIMRAKGLDQRKSGSVIWIAPRDELISKEKSELEAKKSTNQLSEETDTLVTHTYKLNYMRADEAYNVLYGGRRSGLNFGDEATCSPSSTSISIQGGSGGSGNPSGDGADKDRQPKADSTVNININRALSRRGGAAFDLGTNSLVVTDIFDAHQRIAKMLMDLDVPSKQVMIEARIVVADDTFSRDLGAKLGFQGSGKSGNTGFGLGTYDSSAIAATTGVTATAPTTNVNLAATGAPSLGFTIFNASTAAILSLELQALEVDNRGKIVSNPRVVTTNLRPAVILQGEQIPVVTPGSANAPATTTFKDALLCLLVAPQILNNDSIILNVEVTKDARGAQVGDNVAINAKRIKTQVRVNNGETAVLGGIFEQTLRNDTDKVPFLGDLPFLGHLFKSNSKSDVKSEMLIFLTPRILQDDLLSGR